MNARTDFLAEYFGGQKWVLARRTAGIVRRYGEDVICVSAARYRAAEREWRETYGDSYDAVRAELYCAAREMLFAHRVCTENAVNQAALRLENALRAEANAR